MDCPGGSFAKESAASACKTCVPGVWAPNGASSCINCAPGSYSEYEGGSTEASCQPCASGMYATVVAATSHEECNSCAPGLYAPGGSTGCRACPANSYTDNINPGCLACPTFSTSNEGSSLEQCLCAGGYIRDTQFFSSLYPFTCVACPTGKYTTQIGAAACLSCGPGRYSAGAGTYGQESEMCFPCAPGSIAPTGGGGGCTGCERGYYVGESGQTACTPCPVGAFSNGTGASVCSACPAGTFNVRLAMFNCTPCMVGTYGNASMATICRQCEQGKYSEVVGRSACVNCAAGSYSSGAGMTNQTNCTLCRRGYYSMEAGATSSKVCRQCPVGLTTKGKGSVECLPCSPGEFANQMYGSCASCPKHSLFNPNVTLPEDCHCGAGYYLGYNSKALGGAETYEVGSNGQLYRLHSFLTYSDGITVVAPAALAISCRGVAATTPSVWGPAYYPPRVDPATCALPFVMSYPVDVVYDEEETTTYIQCVPCPRGTFSTTGGYWEDCLPCPEGQYQDEPAQSVCKDCAGGLRSSTGADACSGCAFGLILVNNSCVPCPDGYYTRDTGGGGCYACPNNMWSNQVSGGCRLCPYESVSVGGTGVDGCKCWVGLALTVYNNIPYCTKCLAGTFALDGSNVCSPCPPGTFGAGMAMGNCTACPSSDGRAWFSSGGATACLLCPGGLTASSDRGGCVSCPKGKVCTSNGTMLDCPAGTYDNKGNLSSVAQCRPCPANYFCESPTSAELCPTGTYSPPGGIDKHACLCTDQYNCIYTQTTTTKMALNIPQDDFEARRMEFIRAFALAAGVSVDQIKVTWVASAGRRRGNRRILGSSQAGTARWTQVTVVVTGAMRRAGMDSRLRENGIPVLEIQLDPTRKTVVATRRRQRT